MSRLVEDIKDFIEKYGFKDQDINISKLSFRVSLLEEELYETQSALVNHDKEEFVDGLVDLVVVALGTLEMLDVDIEKAWSEVHKANMSKVVGIKPGREISGGFDLKKPDGWVGPSHKENVGRLEKIFD